MVTRVYSRATAGNVRRFLMDLLGELPIPLLSVQVDGGSESRHCAGRNGTPAANAPTARPEPNAGTSTTAPLTIADVMPRLVAYEFLYKSVS